MTTDIKGFIKVIRNLAEKIEKNAEKTGKQTALAVDQVVVLGTPVDTGTARSNWRVSIGPGSGAVHPPYSPGKGLGIGETANATAALDQGRSTINRFALGQEIYISNNLPYIKKLNEGSSLQAPEGFVEDAVQSGVKIVKKARLLK